MQVFTNYRLKNALRKSKSYEEWRETASRYDEVNRLEHWRKRDHTGQYDYASIRQRLDHLRALKARHDHRGLLQTLNEGIHGNMDGMGRSGLYAHALSGTKHLIEHYIDEVVHTLELLAEEDTGDISKVEKLDFFKRASHCFGRSALMLSGSGSLLYFHMGVARALSMSKLLPSIMSGSSGGSIVGSILASHTDDELGEILDADYLADVLDDEGITQRLSPIELLEDGVAKMIPDLTFQQAFDRSGRSINVPIAPAETHQTSRLLNSITAPSVLLRSAVMASSAVPGMFPAVVLEAVDGQGERIQYLPGRKWVDGSMSEDLPAKRLARLYGINHYIVSQTNPLVFPFISDGSSRSRVRRILETGQRTAREWFNTLSLIADQADKRNGFVTRTTSTIRSVLNQDYIGDINIIPDYKFQHPIRLVEGPSRKSIRRLMEAGERCTWPKLERIRQQTLISRTLDKILLDYNEPT